MTLSGVSSFGSMAVGALLVVTGCSKAAQLMRFADVVAAYQLLPPRINVHVATVIVLSEVAIGAAMLLHLWPHLFAIGATVLFAGFAVAMSVNLMRGRHHLLCGCSGYQPSKAISWRAVTHNCVLAAFTCGIAIAGFRGRLEIPTLGGMAFIEAAIMLAAVTLMLIIPRLYRADAHGNLVGWQ